MYNRTYIPLRHQHLHVGVWRWVTPLTRRFSVTYTSMMVYKNAKICVTPDAKHKICVTANSKHKICVTANSKPRREPVVYRLCWVPKQNFRVGHVHFIFLAVHFICVGSHFSVEYGLNGQLHEFSKAWGTIIKLWAL